MKKIILVSVLAAFCSSAGAAESCEQMQQRILKQVIAHGVKAPTVVVAKKSEAAASKAKVVGQCGGGTMVVLYSK